MGKLDLSEQCLGLRVFGGVRLDEIDQLLHGLEAALLQVDFR